MGLMEMNFASLHQLIFRKHAGHAQTARPLLAIRRDKVHIPQLPVTALILAARERFLRGHSRVFERRIFVLREC
jgi:hypothetical protein